MLLKRNQANRIKQIPIGNKLFKTSLMILAFCLIAPLSNAKTPIISKPKQAESPTLPKAKICVSSHEEFLRSSELKTAFKNSSPFTRWNYGGGIATLDLLPTGVGILDRPFKAKVQSNYSICIDGNGIITATTVGVTIRFETWSKAIVTKNDDGSTYEFTRAVR